MLDTHTLGSSATLVKRITSTDGYLNLFPNSEEYPLMLGLQHREIPSHIRVS